MRAGPHPRPVARGGLRHRGPLRKLEVFMSIATKRGDGGQTSLIGNVRVSKGSLRVEAYGTLDELISAMGFARSICAEVDVRDRTKEIQRELFAVGSELATAPGTEHAAEVTPAMIDRLTDDVHRIESVEGVVGDWSLPGEHSA